MNPLKLHHYQFTCMASPCEIKLWLPESTQPDLIKQMVAEANRLEKKYSRYLDDSITSEINRNAGLKPTEIDEETAGLLNFAEVSWQQSNGMFDLTSGILRRAWNFKSGLLPDPKLIDQLLPLIGWGKVIRNQSSVFLPQKEMEIDFGGVVKEYAVDRLAAIAKVNGVNHGLVNLGGDVHVIGPEPDGRLIVVGIRHPREPILKSGIAIKSGGVATSGDYERYIEANGTRYCHILNPKTGWPSAAWQSVTVLAPQCILAGIASSVAMLMPKIEAREWLESLQYGYMLIDGDDTIVHGITAAE